MPGTYRDGTNYRGDPRYFTTPERRGNIVGKLIQSEVVQPISDAYWAITHPRDRMMGRGRAEGGQMIFPLGPTPSFRDGFGGMSKKPPKMLPASMPGYTLERLKHGDPMLNWAGQPRTYLKPKGGGFRPGARGQHLAYNLVDETGEVRGTIDMLRDNPMGEVNVHQVYVDPALNNTKAFTDLAQMALGHELPISAEIVNPRLLKLAKRLRERDPDRFDRLAGFVDPETSRLTVNRGPRTERLMRDGTIESTEKIEGHTVLLGNGYYRWTGRGGGNVQLFNRDGSHRSGARIFSNLEEAQSGIRPARRRILAPQMQHNHDVIAQWEQQSIMTRMREDSARGEAARANARDGLEDLQMHDSLATRNAAVARDNNDRARLAEEIARSRQVSRDRNPTRVPFNPAPPGGAMFNARRRSGR